MIDNHRRAPRIEIDTVPYERFVIEPKRVEELDPQDAGRVQDLRSRIGDIGRRIVDDQQRIREMQKELGALISPVPVGGFVERSDKRRARVTAIVGMDYGRPKLRGVNIKVDGSDGAEIDIGNYSWRAVSP